MHCAFEAVSCVAETVCECASRVRFFSRHFWLSCRWLVFLQLRENAECSNSEGVKLQVRVCVWAVVL
jgi:hypothetical protein